MTTRKSEQLKKSAIIGAVIFAVFGVIAFIVSGSLNTQAEEILDKAQLGTFLGDGSYAEQYATLSTLATVMTVVGVFAIIGGGLYAAWILGVFYRTELTISGDKISGTGVIGLFKRQSFSGDLNSVAIPLYNKIIVSFVVNNVRYSVYTDDAEKVYKILNEKGKK